MNRRKKRRRNSKLLLLGVLIIACVILYLIIFTAIKTTQTTHVVGKIKGFDYTLEKRDSELMKDTFALLKEELSKKDIDYEKYAEYLSELFVIDLYTINNKKSKYDVGGSEYVYSSYVESYNLKVQDTLYRYLATGKNKDYPEVTSVKVDEVTSDLFDYNEEEVEAYTVSISWDYAKENEYDNKAILTLIREGKKLSIAEFDTEVDSDE